MHRVAAGELVIEPALVEELVDAPKLDDPLAALTPREREILALMAEGRTDRGIREALWLSQKTVESHVRSIFRKLDLPATPARQPPRARCLDLPPPGHAAEALGRAGLSVRAWEASAHARPRCRGTVDHQRPVERLHPVT